MRVGIAQHAESRDKPSPDGLRGMPCASTFAAAQVDPFGVPVQIVCFSRDHSAFGVHKCGKPADSELIGRQDRPDGCYIAVGLPQDEPFFLADDP